MTEFRGQIMSLAFYQQAMIVGAARRGNGYTYGMDMSRIRLQHPPGEFTPDCVELRRRRR